MQQYYHLCMASMGIPIPQSTRWQSDEMQIMCREDWKWPRKKSRRWPLTAEARWMIGSRRRRPAIIYFADGDSWSTIESPWLRWRSIALSLWPWHFSNICIEMWLGRTSSMLHMIKMCRSHSKMIDCGVGGDIDEVGSRGWGKVNEADWQRDNCSTSHRYSGIKNNLFWGWLDYLPKLWKPKKWLSTNSSLQNTLLVFISHPKDTM